MFYFYNRINTIPNIKTKIHQRSSIFIQTDQFSFFVYITRNTIIIRKINRIINILINRFMFMKEILRIQFIRIRIYSTISKNSNSTKESKCSI